MVSENKKERIINQMCGTLSEHLYELKAALKNIDYKESDLERWVQHVIKSGLGYSASDNYLVSAQEKKSKMRPDLIISKDGKPIIIVEVKKLGFDLNKSDFRSGKTQLAEYLKTIGNVRWGILTNGLQWRLFDFSQTSSGIEIVSFDLKGEGEEIDLNKKGIEDICVEFFQIHEACYSSDDWDILSKEAIAYSPESIAQAILTLDSVKYISKAIRGEHDYKGNQEILFDRIHSLLVSGLDHLVVGWSEQKELELNKYVSTQKRIGRKKKVASKKNVAEKEVINENPESPTNVVDPVVPKAA